MRSRVLVVDDDESVRESTVLFLELAGLDASGAADGEEALAAGSEVDAVVLDLMLPRIDGFEVCRELRRSSQVPIVILSARSDLSDIVAGLELGADDYVVKPFEGPELLARLRAVMRRATVGEGDAVLEAGPLEIDTLGHRVHLDGVEIECTATEFRLLVELVRHGGQVMTRDLLLERVWGYDYLGDSRLVDMAIKRLRAKLRDGSEGRTFVSTVRGVGYRFERT